MALKKIDLTGKCGSCVHFLPIDGTATGECLQNPYNDSVVHDPKHPHWIVQRSRIKCPLYNAKPQTNADRIRSMSDEELAKFLLEADQGNITVDVCDEKYCVPEQCPNDCINAINKWLQSPAEEKEGMESCL